MKIMTCYPVDSNYNIFPSHTSAAVYFLVNLYLFLQFVVHQFFHYVAFIVFQ